MSPWLLTLPAVLAGGPVVESVSGSTVNWTEGVLIVEVASATTSGSWRDMKALEQEARALLEKRFEAVAPQVAVDSEHRVRDLLQGGGELAEAVAFGMERWRVTETRYRSSGVVELVGELELQPWLRPVLIASARHVDEGTLARPTYTGLLVDARYIGATPVFAPRLLAPDGRSLYGPESLGELAAATRSPAVWVSDPSDPAAVDQAGLAPLVVVAERVDAGRLVLGADDAVLLAAVGGSSLLVESPVVIVVDAP